MVCLLRRRRRSTPTCWHSSRAEDVAFRCSQTPWYTSATKSLGFWNRLPHTASYRAPGLAATTSGKDLPCFLRAATLSRISAHGSVPGNDDRLAGHFCDVRLRRAYMAVDAASCPVVDKGVIAVPKSVSGVQNVGLRKIHG